MMARMNTRRTSWMMVTLLCALGARAPLAQGLAAAAKRAADTANLAHEHPVVSPDGHHIAFVAQHHIFVVQPDGRGLVQVTHSADSEADPAWTREGRIVFTIFANNSSRLFIVDRDGTNNRLLTTVPGRAPVLSPDESHVVYWTGSWTSMRLLIANLDGSAIQQINDGHSIAWNCRWSPSGKQIAFSGKDAGGAMHVFVMNADGTGRRQLTHVPLAEGQAQVPAWAPDGRQVAFQTTPVNGKPGFIWIADAETGVARKLNAHSEPYVDEAPSWFPDGTRLVFQSNHTRQVEIWTIKANGSGLERLNAG
jgi:Tol biopolymer transport system component